MSGKSGTWSQFLDQHYRPKHSFCLRHSWRWSWVRVFKIAEQLGKSYGSCQVFIANYLQFHKMCARGSLAFWSQTTDVWRSVKGLQQGLVHHCTPESKEASMEWWREREAAPVKVRLRCFSFFDQWCILLIDFLYGQCTINAAYYCMRLNDMRAVYHNKRLRQLIRKAIFLHDKASPHTAALMVCKLEEMH